MAQHNPLLLDTLVTSIEANDLAGVQHALNQLPPQVNLPLVNSTQEGFSFFTSLLYAARLGHLQLVTHVLAVLDKAHIKAQDNYGQNALMNAVWSGSLEVVRLLAKHMPIDSRDKWGNTCLHLAAACGHLPLIRLLLEEFDLDPNTENRFGQTPLHCAAECREAGDLLKVLVAAGAGIDMGDADQWTALHHAVYIGDVENVQVLLDLGASVTIGNSSGDTPLTLAMDDPNMVTVIQRRIEVRDKGGSPVLSSSNHILDPVPPLSPEISPLRKPAEDRNHREVLEVDSIGAVVEDTPAHVISDEAFHSAISGFVKKNQCLLSIDLDSLTKYGVEVIPYKELILKEELGRGGYGCVYRGRFRNNQVAIKVVTDRTPSDKMVRDFLKEIECLVKIRHPRFLLLQGICLEGPLCLVTELAKGGNLSDAIEKDRLDPVEKLVISLQIAEGMSFIHNKAPPIIHRDLKPQNILLDMYKQVKIGDLGLSRVVAEAVSSTMRLESTELFAGTIRYMAPEHFDDQPVITRGTDVWAFGCILYQLFTNKAPWSGLELPAVQRRLLLKTEFPIEGDLSPDIRALISSCCRLQASDRPKFGEIVQRLERINGIPNSQLG